MTIASNAVPRRPASSSGTFFGEPRALGYLAFTEAWERFSYYGMTAILVLYMSEALFLPGHVEHIAGFGAFRAGLERLFGPMSPLALASQMFGIYTAFVYFTPVLGGYIADRWLSRRMAVTIGAISMSAGHLAGLRCVLPAGAAAVSWLRPLERQYLHAGRHALCDGRHGGTHARLFHLLDRHQRGRRGRTAGVRPAGAALRLARRLRTGRRVDADRPGDLFDRLPRVDRYHRRRAPGRHPGCAARPRAVAHRRRPVRRDGHDDIPIDRLLSELEHGPDLDREQCRPGPVGLPCTRGLVQLHRSAGQHRRRAVCAGPLAPAGQRWRRAGRHRQDRHGRMDCLHRQPAAGDRLRRDRPRAGAGASRLRYVAGPGLPVLLADAAGAGLARRAAARALHLDGHGIPDAVHRQFQRRLARQPV